MSVLGNMYGDLGISQAHGPRLNSPNISEIDRDSWSSSWLEFGVGVEVSLNRSRVLAERRVSIGFEIWAECSWDWGCSVVHGSVYQYVSTRVVCVFLVLKAKDPLFDKGVGLLTDANLVCFRQEEILLVGEARVPISEKVDEWEHGMDKLWER